MYEIFGTYKEMLVEVEEELADERISIYEDYFDKLDRLEEKHKRKQDREDIEAQLQRLQGATDEASRKKAKELKAKLIQMDEESAELEREELRESLISGIEDSVEKLNTVLNEFITNWMNSIDSSMDGQNLTEDFIQGLVGLNIGIDEEMARDIYSDLLVTEDDEEEEDEYVEDSEIQNVIDEIGLIEDALNDPNISEEQRTILNDQLQVAKEQLKSLVNLEREARGLPLIED